MGSVMGLFVGLGASLIPGCELGRMCDLHLLLLHLPWAIRQISGTGTNISGLNIRFREPGLCSCLPFVRGRGCFQTQPSQILLLPESPVLLQCKYCGSACNFVKLLSGKSHRAQISRSFVKFLLPIYGIYTKGVEISYAAADSLPPGRAADLRAALTPVQSTELPSVPCRTSWTLNSASSHNSFLTCPAALQAPVCLKCHFLL